MTASNKRAGAQASDSVATEAAPAEKKKKTLKPRQCRNFTRDEVAEAMPEIVATFVSKATEGSVQHFASLAKFGGFDDRPIAPPASRRKSFARRLLEDLQEHEARMLAQNAAKSEAKAEAASSVERP